MCEVVVPFPGSNGGVSTVDARGGSGLDAICDVCEAAAFLCPRCSHAVCEVCLLEQGDCPVCLAFCPACASRPGEEKGALMGMEAANDDEGTLADTRTRPSWQGQAGDGTALRGPLYPALPQRLAQLKQENAR